MIGLVPLYERRELLSDKLFNSILCNPSNKLYSLLPSKNEDEVNLRNKRVPTLATCTRNGFIHHYVNIKARRKYPLFTLS